MLKNVIGIAVAAAALAGGAPAHARIDRVLAVSGTGAVPTYRIPALAVTNRGTLIATFDERISSSRDLPNDIRIAQRRSLDGGLTWSPPIIAAAFPAGGTGDSSLLVDRITGRIFLFYAYGPPGVGFFESRPGSSDALDSRTVHAMVQWSDDDAATWSKPLDLNRQIKNPVWRALFASSGHGIQTRSGRLIQPYVVMDATGKTHAADAYSDDHGASWRMGAFAGTDVNESKAVQLRDGSIVQNMRHNTLRLRFLAVSRDGGRSFGPMRPDAALPDPGVNADEIADGNALLFVNPANAVERRNLTLRTSCDGGKTWPQSRILHAGPAAYAVMAPLPGNVVAVVYENGRLTPYENLTFTRLAVPACSQIP